MGFWWLTVRGWAAPLRAERAPEYDRSWMPPYWRLVYSHGTMIACEDGGWWWETLGLTATGGK